MNPKDQTPGDTTDHFVKNLENEHEEGASAMEDLLTKNESEKEILDGMMKLLEKDSREIIEKTTKETSERAEKGTERITSAGGIEGEVKEAADAGEELVKKAWDISKELDIKTSALKKDVATSSMRKDRLLVVEPKDFEIIKKYAGKRETLSEKDFAELIPEDDRKSYYDALNRKDEVLDFAVDRYGLAREDIKKVFEEENEAYIAKQARKVAAPKHGGMYEDGTPAPYAYKKLEVKAEPAQIKVEKTQEVGQKSDQEPSKFGGRTLKKPTEEGRDMYEDIVSLRKTLKEKSEAEEVQDLRPEEAKNAGLTLEEWQFVGAREGIDPSKMKGDERLRYLGLKSKISGVTGDGQKVEKTQSHKREDEASSKKKETKEKNQNTGGRESIYEEGVPPLYGFKRTEKESGEEKDENEAKGAETKESPEVEEEMRKAEEGSEEEARTDESIEDEMAQTMSNEEEEFYYDTLPWYKKLTLRAKEAMKSLGSSVRKWAEEKLTEASSNVLGPLKLMWQDSFVNYDYLKDKAVELKERYDAGNKRIKMFEGLIAKVRSPRERERLGKLLRSEKNKIDKIQSELERRNNEKRLYENERKEICNEFIGKIEAILNPYEAKLSELKDERNELDKEIKALDEQEKGFSKEILGLEKEYRSLPFWAFLRKGRISRQLNEANKCLSEVKSLLKKHSREVRKVDQNIASLDAKANPWRDKRDYYARMIKSLGEGVSTEVPERKAEAMTSEEKGPKKIKTHTR